jgi:hypothetical protein
VLASFATQHFKLTNFRNYIGYFFLAIALNLWANWRVALPPVGCTAVRLIEMVVDENPLIKNIAKSIKSKIKNLKKTVHWIINCLLMDSR